MNNQAVNNRIYATVLAALLGPVLEARGVKLTLDEYGSLVAATPIVFHALAGVWEKCCAAFVLYFPPKNPNPTQPVEPVKV